MKKIIKNIFIFLVPISLILFIIFSFNVIKTDIKYAHQSSMVYNPSFDWQKYFILNEIDLFFKKFKTKNIPTNIEKINFYISEQKTRSLLANTPNSTKRWVQAKMQIGKNEKLKKIKFRYRGDNPSNWLKTKKTFRIKTKRSEQINGYRNFDYLIFSGEQFLSYTISEKMKLVNQKPFLKEVFINGESKGLFIELQNFDENFLRQNRFMPVNLYKGENHAVEKRIGLNDNLFNNHNLWSKVAIFNQNLKKDKSDLEKFLVALNKNKSQTDFLSLDFIDVEYFSKFEAFLTLTQNPHHDWFHNLRLAVDPWSGKITQFITDPVISNRIPGYGFLIDFSSNDLNSYLNLRTDFLHEKYKWLYHFTKYNDVVSEIEKYFIGTEDDFNNINAREPFSLSNLNHVNDIKIVINTLKENKNEIIKILETNKNSSWKKSKNGFEIVVGSSNSLSNLQLIYDNDIPEWIGIDLNYNNIIDDTEPKFFIKENSNIIEIPVVLYANRIISSNKQSNIDHDYKIDSVDTKFSFISQSKKNPTKIHSENYFTKDKTILVEVDEHKAVKKNKNNLVINLKEDNIPRKIFSGEIIVDENMIIKDPVEIRKGTKFLINPEKHILFKNTVIAIGDRDNPIIFKENNYLKDTKQKLKPWGTVALVGEKTRNSIFNHTIFQGGSGGHLNQYSFTSMFSIHDTKNIEVKNSKFLNNKIYDDTIHAVYSDEILFNNIEINNAFSDAIDIDLSKNINLKNIIIKSPKNDGIDFMETNALVENVKIFNAGDKGISVGENSKVVIQNSEFVKNEIGVSSKDNSKTKIYNSKFENNNYQIASYAKNWRYSGGGKVETFDTNFFSSKKNQFITSNDPANFEDKNNKDLIQNSTMSIINSTIDGEILKIGDRVLFITK